MYTDRLALLEALEKSLTDSYYLSCNGLARIRFGGASLEYTLEAALAEVSEALAVELALQSEAR
jgi:hypothetical protein